MNKTLYILRGVSGCGKTTLATQLCELPNTISIAADDFHYDKNGNYNFKFENLSKAHEWCKGSVDGLMTQGFNVVLHNTNTSEKEIKPYIELAGKYDYKVVSLVVEKRHNNKNVHDVPEGSLDKQEKRLLGSIKLR